MNLFRRSQPPSPAAPQQPTAPALELDPGMGDRAAAWLRAALAQRDWPAVRDFLYSVRDPDDHAFYLTVCANVPGVQDWIDEWIAAEPRATLPLLVRGAHGVYWAWEARGSAGSGQTSQQQFKEFFRRLKMAENCLDEVVERDPDDTTAWTFLMHSGRGRQVDRDEAQRRFDEVVRRHPYHRIAHTQMLRYLCKKWYGSHEEMFDFARQAAGRAPAGDPLATVLAEAHIEKWLDLPAGEDAAYMSQHQVVAELNQAADRSVRHPRYAHRPDWATVHNVYAFAFVCAGDWNSACGQFDVIGDTATEYPWYYLHGDPAVAFTGQRDKAYSFRTGTRA